MEGKSILLCVTGGIAAYKAVELLRLLKKDGADVWVVMTPHAVKFVTPLTFQTLSGHPVTCDLFHLDTESRIGHIHLAESADLALAAPCTAATLARLRLGLAEDPVSTTLLATRAPVFLAPAMNDAMWENPATMENVEVLKQRGVEIIPPEVGFLAEGKQAVGRLAEPTHILEAVRAYFGRLEIPGPLKGRRILITAGPTVEPLDPVRYLSNHSSGRMGLALAAACKQLGGQVTLVRGPVSLPDPPGVRVIAVTTADEMAQAVSREQPDHQGLILAAAVADFRPARFEPQKIKRAERKTLTLELAANPDIAALAGAAKPKGQALVIFAAETENLAAHAAAKLTAKNADLVVANDITQKGAGFHTNTNVATLIFRDPQTGRPGQPETLPIMEKTALAMRIAQDLAQLIKEKV